MFDLVGVDVSLVVIRAQLPDRDCRGLVKLESSLAPSRHSMHGEDVRDICNSYIRSRRLDNTQGLNTSISPVRTTRFHWPR